MAPLAGKYQHERNENLVALLKAQGAPDDQAQKADAFHPSLEISVDGDSYKCVGGLLDHTVVYKLNQEIEDRIEKYNIVYKSTATLNGNNLVVASKSASGDATAEYKPTDSGLEITSTSSKGGSIVAKIYYKRV